jgi:alpha-beta hydrolase superfamily lysophospholipase
MTGVPTWFGPIERPLHGWVHVPKNGRARGVTVFCPPLGREAANALPAVQVACAQAAAAGMAALRFAYDGTGDSAGRLSDPDRVSTWLDSIDQAVELARTLCPGPVILVGLRAGGLLATAACDRGTAVDGLVLWDPSPSGRRFLRLEQTLLATGFAVPQPDDGSVSGPAFSYSPQTVHDLSPIGLHPLGPSGPPTIVFGRAGDRTTDSIRREFEEAGADWIDAEGQSELFDRYPDDLVVPRTMIKALVERIGQLVVGPEEPVHFVPGDDAVVLYDGSPVREHPLWLGPNRIFAMSSEPAGGDELAGGPTLVFLSAGALDHTGPGRRWVELTRQFATEGLRTLRVDLDGLGETEGRPDLPRNVPKLPTAIDDVCDLCTALGDPEARDIVFVGLSSGGYHAIEAALRLHPRAICVMNPGITAPVAELDSGEPIDPRRRAYRPRPAVLRRMAVKHKRMARFLSRALLQVAVWRSPHRPVAEVSRRRIPFLLILTEEDSEHFEPSPYWWLVRRRLEQKELLNERIVPGFDHSLYTIRGQDNTYPILISWITDRYGRRSPEAEASPVR